MCTAWKSALTSASYTSQGNSEVRSMSAARGAILSSARARTASRSASCSSDRANAGKSSLMPLMVNRRSAVALDGDPVDGGLVVARVVGRQLGEPDEDVADVHRRARLKLRGAARVRDARDRGKPGRDGLAPGAQLDVRARVDQGQPDRGDGDRAAHVQQ